MRKHLYVLAATTALLAASFVAAPAQAVPADHLVINEVYARGGSANAPYTKKFVELYNPTSQSIELAGWTLGYSAATNAGIGNSCALSGAVAAGGYFVIGAGSNGATGEAVTTNLDCTFSLSGTNRAVTLLNGADTVDLVGYGTAVRFEAAAAAYPGANADQGSINRTGGADTDDNAADFSYTKTVTPGAEGPAPTASPTDTTPTVEPTPQAPITIAQIQGTGAESALKGQAVTTVGVVTAAYPTGGFNGAFIQTPGTGGTTKTAADASDGIFVWGNAAAAATVGQCYTVSGTVAEYSSAGGSLTQLSSPALTPMADCARVVATTLAELPADDVKNAYEGMLVQPTGTYTITNNYALNQYGSLGLAFGTEPLFQATDVVRPGAEALAYEQANLRKAITLDDGSSWNYMSNATAKASPLPYLSAETPMRTGSPVTFDGPVILEYRFGGWNYQPRSQVVGPEVDFLTSVNDRPTTAPAVGGDVQLASFNVLNYFDDLGVAEADCRAYNDMYGNPVGANGCQVRGAYSESAFADQEAKIVAAINKLDADVVGLQEIENSAGITYLPGQSRDKALATLVAALNAAGGNWAFAPSPVVTPPNEDVIRTAFIYDPATIELVGPSHILLDAAFADARQPLAQEFKVKGSGTTFVAIVNHFKSKGSGVDDGTGQGNANPSREAQATALSTWANTFDEFEDKAVFLMGDFNAYTKETPVQIIEAAGYANLTEGGVTQDATYQFSGRLGSLDHVFANADALDLVTDAAVWNINGDESIAFQYSRRNYNTTDYHVADEFASSDHDPVVVGIEVPGVKPSPQPSKSPSATPTVPPQRFVPTPPYTAPGRFHLNGRDWVTTCEPYSQTLRCRTEIWATVVVIEDGQFVRRSGWAFNNLTYLPYMTRQAWAANPLGHANEWTAADGRKWRTECDTAATGRNGCRSYALVTVYKATPEGTGGYAFSQANEWVFNNIVMFGGPELR
ncbi:SpnA family nuclease [Tessaracoccus lubricantis]|uniref:SpnA family nuclease n=1 Tax=Tessaracoccus lubricantis TaxID=545543 RepID=A0ABP9FGU9_9ACTN